MAAQVRRTEAMPPGWYVLCWLVHRAGVAVGGEGSVLASVRGLRVLSVGFTATAAALVVVYAARMLPLWAAGLAGGVAALGDQFLELGSELRAYALLVLACVVFALALDAASRQPDRWRLFALAAATLVGATTHYFFLTVVTAGVAWVWASKQAAGGRRRVTATMAAGVAPLVLWVPSFLDQYRGHPHQWLGRFSVAHVVSVYSKIFASPVAWDRLGAGGTLANSAARLALVLAIIVGLIMLTRNPRGGLCATLAVLPVVIAAAVWAAGPRVFDARNMVVVAPFAAIAVAAAVAAIPHRLVARLAALALMVGLMGSIAAESSEGRTGYDRISRAVVTFGWTPAQPLIVFAPRGLGVHPPPTLSWYLPGHPLLADARLTQTGCTDLFVVAQDPKGRRWLRAHVTPTAPSRSFPSYGTGEFGVRLPGPVVVARLPYSSAVAQSALRAHGRFATQLLHHPACLSPLPNTLEAY